MSILTRNLEPQLKWKKLKKKPQTNPDMKSEYLYGSSIISQWSRKNCSQHKTLCLIHSYKDFTWVPVPAKPPNTDTQLLSPVQTPLAWTIYAPVVKTLTNVGFIKMRKWVGSLILARRVILFGCGFFVVVIVFCWVFFTHFQEGALHKNIR